MQRERERKKKKYKMKRWSSGNRVSGQNDCFSFFPMSIRTNRFCCNSVTSPKYIRGVRSFTIVSYIEYGSEFSSNLFNIASRQRQPESKIKKTKNKKNTLFATFLH